MGDWFWNNDTLVKSRQGRADVLQDQEQTHNFPTLQRCGLARNKLALTYVGLKRPSPTPNPHKRRKEEEDSKEKPCILAPQVRITTLVLESSLKFTINGVLC